MHRVPLLTSKKKIESTPISVSVLQTINADYKSKGVSEKVTVVKIKASHFFLNLSSSLSLLLLLLRVVLVRFKNGPLRVL